MQQGLSLQTLQSCLGGVEEAYRQIGASNMAGAVGALSHASSPCLSLGGGTGRPVYPFDFPDPFVMRVGRTYYAYATNSAAGNIQIVRSSNLSTWTVVGDALPHLPTWSAPGATWAPSVLQVGPRFVMYYSAVFAASGMQCISAAVATSPEGPFVDTSALPIVCQVAAGGSIDPSPFVDAHGNGYLVWKSQGGGGQPPSIWAQQLDPSGTKLLAGSAPARLLRPSQAWEGGVVEGPDMVSWAGHDYLFYSANGWNSADYAIGVATCAGPTGPCTKALGRPVLASQSSFAGPGGPSIFADAHGGVWLAFHAWRPGAVGFPNDRALYLRKVVMVGGLPVVQPSG